MVINPAITRNFPECQLVPRMLRGIPLVTNLPVEDESKAYRCQPSFLRVPIILKAESLWSSIDHGVERLD